MRMFIIFQTRITLYFKSISNNDQKEHKIKVWKTTKNNHTIWFFFCSHVSRLFTSFSSRVKSFKNDHFQAIYDDLTSTRFSIKFFNFCRHFSSSFYFLNYSRVCRICHETFDFNNALHKHLKINHRNFSSRRFLKESQKKKRKKKYLIVSKRSWERKESNVTCMYRLNFNFYLITNQISRVI